MRNPLTLVGGEDAIVNNITLKTELRGITPVIFLTNNMDCQQLKIVIELIAKKIAAGRQNKVFFALALLPTVILPAIIVAILSA